MWALLAALFALMLVRSAIAVVNGVRLYGPEVIDWFRLEGPWWVAPLGVVLAAMAAILGWLLLALPYTLMRGAWARTRWGFPIDVDHIDVDHTDVFGAVGADDTVGSASHRGADTLLGQFRQWCVRVTLVVLLAAPAVALAYQLRYRF